MPGYVKVLDALQEGKANSRDQVDFFVTSWHLKHGENQCSFSQIPVNVKNCPTFFNRWQQGISETREPALPIRASQDPDRREAPQGQGGRHTHPGLWRQKPGANDPDVEERPPGPHGRSYGCQEGQEDWAERHQRQDHRFESLR